MRFGQIYNRFAERVNGPFLQIAILIIVMVVVVAAVVFVERGQRKIPVQYAKRVVGRRVYGGQATHLPLRVNSGGVIPVIFAASIVSIPATLAAVVQVQVDEKPFLPVVTGHAAV